MEGELDHSVDLSALINVILPLELYKQESFPSEQSYKHLRQLVHAHFSSSPTNINPRLLFSICTTLRNEAQFSISSERLLPSVLRCLRNWRLLDPPERHSDEAICALSARLAGLVNCQTLAGPVPEHRGGNWLSIRWIGVDSEYWDAQTLPIDPSNSEQDFSPERRQTTPRPRTERRKRRSSSASLHPSIVEMAALRSGCRCCRNPRHSHSKSLPNTIHASGQDVPHVSNDTHVHPGALRGSPPTSNRPAKHFSRSKSKEVDENVPPLPIRTASSTEIKSRRIASKSQPTSAPKPRTTIKPALPAVMETGPSTKTHISSHNTASQSTLHTKSRSLSSLSHVSSISRPHAQTFRPATTASRPPFGSSNFASKKATHPSPASNPRPQAQAVKSAVTIARAPFGSSNFAAKKTVSTSVPKPLPQIKPPPMSFSRTPTSASLSPRPSSTRPVIGPKQSTGSRLVTSNGLTATNNGAPKVNGKAPSGAKSRGVFTSAPTTKGVAQTRKSRL